MTSKDTEPKSINPLTVLGEVGQAISMIKGGGPKEARRTVKKKSEVPIRTPDRPVECAKVSTKEGTPEWHQEVVKAMAHGELPPEMTIADTDVVTGTISQHRAEVGWLVGGDSDPMPVSREVRQVAADIANSSFKDDPSYLLAKGAQLHASIRSDMTASEVHEIYQACARIEQQLGVTLAKLKNPDPELASLVGHHLSPKKEQNKGWQPQGDEQIIDMGQDRTAVSSEAENTVAWAQEIEKQVLDDGKRTPEVKLTVSSEEAQRTISERASDSGIVKPGETVVNQQVAQILYDTLTASDETLASKEFWLVKGNQLRRLERANMSTEERNELQRYRDRFRDRVKEMYAKDAVGLAERGLTLDDIQHEVSGLESGMPVRKGKKGPEVWNRVPTGNTKLDNTLREIQNSLDNDPNAAQSTRFFSWAISELRQIDPVELAKAGDPLLKLNTLMGKAAGSELDFWNNFSVSPYTQELLFLYPKAAIDEHFGVAESLMDFWGEGPFSNAMERELGKLAEFASSNEYGLRLEEYIKIHYKEINLAFAAEIKAGTYIAIDPSHIKNHEFYTSRVEEMKGLYDSVNFRVALERCYGAKNGNLPLDKQREIAGYFGDKGVSETLRGNGGVNQNAYEFYRATLKQFQQNYHSGVDQRLTPEEMQLANTLLVDYLLQNKAIFDPMIQGSLEREIPIKPTDGRRIPTISRELDEKMAKKIAREVTMLASVTGAEEEEAMGGLAPMEAAQNGQPTAFNATMGFEQGLQARAPLRWFFDHWDLYEGSGWDHIREWAHECARSQHIDRDFDKMMKKIMANSHGNYRNDPEYQALLSYTFNVVEQDPVKRAAVEKAKLKKLFSTTLDHRNRRPPESLVEVTPKLLREAYMFKKGILVAEAMGGAYGYESSFMYFNTVKAMTEFIYGQGTPANPTIGDLIGLEHKVRAIGNDLINAETEADLEQAVDGLIGTDSEPGPLRLSADIMPHRLFEQMMKHRSVDMRIAFRSDLNNHLFKTFLPGVNLQAIDVGLSKDMRWDIVVREVEKRYLLADTLNAKQGVKPYDYHLSLAENNRRSPGVYENIQRACNSMGIKGKDNTKAYLDVMKWMSDHVRDDQALHELTSGSYLDFYRTVSGESAYIQYFTDPLTAPGNKFGGLTTEQKHLMTENFYTNLGGRFGQGPMSILARWNGDTFGVRDAATTALYAMIGATDEKGYLENLTKLLNSAMFSGGRTPKNRYNATLSGSWIKTIKTDKFKDALLQNGMPNSSAQRRAVGENGLSVGLNDAHHLYSEVQKIGKTKFSEVIPETNSAIEQELGMIWKIKIPFTKDKYWEPMIPVWIYRIYLLGLIALALGAAKTKEEAQKGLSGGSSGGGGGEGGGEHGGH